MPAVIYHRYDTRRLFCLRAKHSGNHDKEKGRKREKNMESFNHEGNICLNDSKRKCYQTLKSNREDYKTPSRR